MKSIWVCSSKNGLARAASLGLWALLGASLVASCGADTQGGGTQGNGSSNQGSTNGSGTGPSFAPLADELKEPTKGQGQGDTAMGPADGKGCNKFDVVFAVDNSGSMKEEQRVMGSEIFPKFAEKLLNVRTDIDGFRVGVTDACPNPTAFNSQGRDNGACGFSSGKNWIESSSPSLSDEFACVGAIDSSNTKCNGNNDDEQPASAALASLSAVGAGGANEGFLRADAVLVVVAMTDEDEQPKPMKNANELHDSLVALKKDPKAVVFLGIGGKNDCKGPYGDANEAKVLQELSALFAADGRGVFWDLCAGSLEDGLESVMATIGQACEDFIPPAL